MMIVFNSSELLVSAFTGEIEITDYDQKKELLSSTNTFELQSFDIVNKTFIYNMATRIVKPIMSSAQITVFTHGIGEARDWSNQYDSNNDLKFAYTHKRLCV